MFFEDDQAIAEYEPDRNYAPDMLLDPHNPANDQYFKSLDALRALAVQQSGAMRQRHVEIVRRSHTGAKPSDIATDLKIAVQTVYAVLRRPESATLLSTLRHIGHLIDGPNLELRKHVLWRIAKRNEVMEPNVTISAMKELNKLDGAYPVQTQPTVPAVNITINQDSMPRTALDEAP